MMISFDLCHFIQIYVYGLGFPAKRKNRFTKISYFSLNFFATISLCFRISFASICLKYKMIMRKFRKKKSRENFALVISNSLHQIFVKVKEEKLFIWHNKLQILNYHAEQRILLSNLFLQL